MAPGVATSPLSDSGRSPASVPSAIVIKTSKYRPSERVTLERKAEDD